MSDGRRRTMRRSTTSWMLVLLASLALVTGACGARWTDEQHALVAGRDDAGERVLVDATDSSSAATTPDAATEQASTVTTARPGTSDSGGTTAGPVAGGADPAAPIAAGGAAQRPCSAPSAAPGVSESEIRLATISTISGPSPGLGASAAAAVPAYAAYRNSTGGVCGRQLVVKVADDGGDAGRYRTILQELGPDVLAMAGGLSIGDDGAGPIIERMNIPSLASRSGEGVAGLPSVFDLNPPFPNLDDPIGKYDWLFGQGAKTVAMVYLAVDASRLEARTQQSLMEASGMRIVEVVELPITTLNFDSAARQVANSKADYMMFIGAAESNGSMARAMLGTGYQLKFADYFSFGYGPRFIDLAGPEAAEGATTWIRNLPHEEAGSNPEMQAFLDWMQRTSPGTSVDEFGADSWAAAKALIDSLEALGGPITREAVIGQLRSIDRFDAGGMFGPIRLGPQENLGCFVGMQVRGGAWQRLAPDSGFLC